MIIKDNIFENLQFVIDLPITSTYKTKEALKRTIADRKGVVSYVINRNTSYVIRDLNDSDSYKSRRAVKLGIPILGANFVEECTKSHTLLDWRKFAPDIQKTNINANIDNGIIQIKNADVKTSAAKPAIPFSTIKVWPYQDSRGPVFHQHDHSIAKVIALNGRNKKGIVPFAVLELHVLTGNVEDFNIPRFSVFVHHGTMNMADKKVSGHKDCRFFENVNYALLAYLHLYKLYTNPPNSMHRAQQTFDVRLGSDNFYPEEWLPVTTSLDPHVAQLVDHVWSEAMTAIVKALDVDLKTISAEKIEKAKMLLQEISAFKDQDVESKRYQELRDILPCKGFSDTQSQVKKCQLLQDMLALREMMDDKSEKQVDERYKALHCHIEGFHVTDNEYRTIQQLITQTSGETKIMVDGIYKIHQHLDHSRYRNETGNEKMLFYGVPVKEVFSVLSRGFLPRKVEFSPQLNGVSFASSMESAIKNAENSTIKGTRMVFVSQVALGNVLDINAKQMIADTTEFNSIHCVKQDGKMSEFEDDTYIITNMNQHKITYLIECHLQNDVTRETKLKLYDKPQQITKIIENDDFLSYKNIDLHHYLYAKPANADINPGLQSVGSKTIPLKAVHVRAKLVDLAAEVVLIQEYVNTSSSVIEAKYLFPLDDKVAVCGFEAFTEGRHFVGRIEEKQTARQEYQQAVDAGQKAFLMEEESPEVFSIKIGSISPHATVMTKITYVTELDLEGDFIRFQVARLYSPPQTQDPNAEAIFDVSDAEDLKTSVEVSLDMPFPIKTLTSYTHKLIFKKTETRAVVTLNKDEKLDSGFLLLIGLSEIHKPRMWVEEHPTLKTEACMLTFYPEFDVESLKETEIIIAIDCSNSMSGEVFENAQDIALLCIHFLPQDCKFNVARFGTVYEELFPTIVPNSFDTIHEAEQFVLNSQPQSGNSEVRHLLHTYHLLPPSSDVRNIIVISDGHFNGADELFSDAAAHRQETRIFALAAGSDANKHLLRSLAFSGGGAYDHFDPRLKSKWESKIKNVISNTQEPVLTNVSVEWQQFNAFDPPPVQAPKIITSVFNGNRLIVYGFVSNCTLATLKANVNGIDLTSVVNTTELAKSKGSIVSALTTRAIVQDWEQGCLSLNRTRHEILKRRMKPKIINLSKTYSIVSSLTSFVSVEDTDETSNNSGAMTLDDLLKIHSVDFLDYISYEAGNDFSLTKSFFLKASEKDDDKISAVEELIDDELMSYQLCSTPAAPPDAFEVEAEAPENPEWRKVLKKRRYCKMATAKKEYKKASKGFEIPQQNSFETIAGMVFKTKPDSKTDFLSEIWDIQDEGNASQPTVTRQQSEIESDSSKPPTKASEIQHQKTESLICRSMFKGPPPPSQPQYAPTSVQFTSTQGEKPALNEFLPLPQAFFHPPLLTTINGYVQPTPREANISRTAQGYTAPVTFGSPGIRVQCGLTPNARSMASIASTPVFSLAEENTAQVCSFGAFTAPAPPPPDLLGMGSESAEMVSGGLSQAQSNAWGTAKLGLEPLTGDSVNEPMEDECMEVDQYESIQCRSILDHGDLDLQEDNSSSSEDEVLSYKKSAPSSGDTLGRCAKSSARGLLRTQTFNIHACRVANDSPERDDLGFGIFEDEVAFCGFYGSSRISKENAGGGRGLGKGGAKRHRRVTPDRDMTYPLNETLILDKSPISAGSGLPFVSTILKLFPKRDWCYKHVSQRQRQFEKITSPSDPSEHELLQELLPFCNDLGGIKTSDLPPMLQELADEADRQLKLLGLNSLSLSVQKATLSLITSLAAIFAICYEINEDVFPLDLSDLATIEEQSELLLENLFDDFPEWVQFTFYGLLVYVKWCNQSFPLLYHSLELGNCWEEALQKFVRRIRDEME